MISSWAMCLSSGISSVHTNPEEIEGTAQVTQVAEIRAQDVGADPKCNEWRGVTVSSELLCCSYNPALHNYS